MGIGDEASFTWTLGFVFSAWPVVAVGLWARVPLPNNYSWARNNNRWPQRSITRQQVKARCPSMLSIFRKVLNVCVLSDFRVEFAAPKVPGAARALLSRGELGDCEDSANCRTHCAPIALREHWWHFQLWGERLLVSRRLSEVIYRYIILLSSNPCCISGFACFTVLGRLSLP